jgi:hypothetical protein
MKLYERAARLLMFHAESIHAPNARALAARNRQAEAEEAENLAEEMRAASSALACIAEAARPASEPTTPRPEPGRDGATMAGIKADWDGWR